MTNVVSGAVVAVALALVWIGVDWPRFGRALAVLSMRRRDRVRITSGWGFRIVTDGRAEISSLQVYANGTTQVWLKRKAAA